MSIIHHYDKYVFMFSGGKDSTAAYLSMKDDIDPEKVEFWHHDIDGRGERFMDWPITEGYCRAFASHFKAPILFSWKEGGFLREMLRENSKTAPIQWEELDGSITKSDNSRSKPNTRRKFPQVTADLRQRWCSAYLKIDVADRVIRNSPRFQGKRVLVITGERAQESPGRAKYEVFEPHRSDLRNGKRTVRTVDHYRPIHSWDEGDVWATIQHHKVRVHPAYYLGFSRVSCQFCIFGNADQWASAYRLDPARGYKMIQLEKDFGVTLKRKTDLKTLIESGNEYPAIHSEEVARISQQETYNLPIEMTDWFLPSGAFGDSCGPT